MNWAHVHLSLNHLPVVGTFFGVLLLLLALLRKSEELKRVSQGRQRGGDYHALQTQNSAVTPELLPTRACTSMRSFVASVASGQPLSAQTQREIAPVQHNRAETDQQREQLGEPPDPRQ